LNFEYLRHLIRARMFVTIGNPARAIEEYRQALGHEPASVKARTALAHLLAADKCWDEAERLFEQTVDQDRGDAIAWFNLGFIRHQQGRLDAAIEAFSRAVEIKPAIDRAWYGMGMAQASLGRHEQAASALERAAELQPMNSHAWYNLGMAYHTLHRPEKVEEVIRHIHRFDPKISRQLILETGRSDLAHLIGT